MKSNLKERKSFLEMIYIVLGFNISMLSSVQLVTTYYS